MKNKEAVITITGIISPCPFCGSNDLTIHSENSKDGSITWYRILHGPSVKCGASMLSSSKESLFKNWNTRFLI